MDVIKLHFEEELLEKQFGKEYQQYCQKTNKLVPFIF
jgi:protein-S-isoprenylcysteine O-methyltransferase Ste14